MFVLHCVLVALWNFAIQGKNAETCTIGQETVTLDVCTNILMFTTEAPTVTTAQGLALQTVFTVFLCNRAGEMGIRTLDFLSAKHF